MTAKQKDQFLRAGFTDGWRAACTLIAQAMRENGLPGVASAVEAHADRPPPLQTVEVKPKPGETEAAAIARAVSGGNVA
jgi:hypothetical protein